MSTINKVVNLMAAPKYHIGSSEENKKGLQERRIRKIQRSKSKANGMDSQSEKILSDLNESGLCILENYLPVSEHAQIVAEGEDKVRERNCIETLNKNNTNINWNTFLFAAKHSVIEKRFTGNPILRNVVESYTGKAIRHTPEAIFQHLHLPEGLEDRHDEETVLHSDRYYPTIKAFYSVNEHTLDNGAFIYSRKSHIMDDRRVHAESDLAVREALMREGRGDEIASDLLERGRNRITADQRKLFPKSSITCKENSLIIADVSGYHCRGMFQRGGLDRITIRFIFHYIYAPVWAQQVAKLLGKSPGRYLN
jgi:hypothetical protein